MPPLDPRSQVALEAAIQRIKTTVLSVAARVGETLSAQAQAGGARAAERDLLNTLQFELRRNVNAFNRTFEQVLREKIDAELSPREDAGRKLATATWQTLSLVGEEEMEERMFADRIGQTISHECDAELRELAPYMGTLLAAGRADLERNPLRADMLGTALYRGIETVTTDPAGRKVLSREFGQTMAKAMALCYLEIIKDLQSRGVRPAVLTARSVEGPGASGNSGYATLGPGHSQHGDFEPTPNASLHDSGTQSGFAPRSMRHGSGGGTVAGGMNTRSGYGPRTGMGSGLGGGGMGGSMDGGHGSSGPRADAQLMSLLRRLTSVVSRPGELGTASAQGGHPSTSASRPGSLQRTDFGPRGTTGFGRSDPGGSSSFGAISRHGAMYRPGITHADSGRGDGGRGDSSRGDSGAGIDGLMAVNLIRAHREELLQASNGQLDHMVIDVVGSLFDQILSDARVPPQMARQIARLQLPVLRVALSDATFFSSRRHPVRRFVNRIASLACAFDDFDDGAGRQFLSRVRELVQEIVDGDFDQIEIYTAKLVELEAFIAEQAEGEANQNGAAVTLEKKETELRVQQRYMQQLQAALAPLPMPGYLRDFLPQVWSQALVLASNQDGPDSDRSQRFRRAARDLIMSVQPKGSPILRKKFLMQLPPLMKDLNEGMKLVGWPEAAQREFFAKLMPAHAESLKATAMSELDHNMMVKHLEGIFNIGLPSTESLPPVDDVPEEAVAAVEHRFTPEEAKKVGLIEESAVDWSGSVDIDIDLDIPESTRPQALAESVGEAEVEAQTSGSPLLDAALDQGAGESAGEAPEPTRGLALMDHIKLGFAYQMHLKEEWQKVRLTHVSPGRAFFVFTRGHKHQETISMTSRMLARMCETGRMRAVESAYLMERATQRARKQLAALKGAPARV